MKKIIKVGNISLGGPHIVIQSMTNTKTADTLATIKQINELCEAGCEMVRVAVKDMDDAIAIKDIKKEINCPIIADIHYDEKLALASIEAGADKIRINPGNTSTLAMEKIVESCKKHHIPIRIGVNSGSLSPEILAEFGSTPKGMLAEVEKTLQIFKKLSFDDLVISIKATNIDHFIEANRLLATKYNYPIHIGLTEAGPLLGGAIRSSYAIGTLLKEGIGDTIRVSLTGNPVNEVYAAKEILKMFGKFQGVTVISCPTCGRCEYDMEKIIDELLPHLYKITKPLKIAIMGCVVNGIGEGKEADYGIAGGKEKGVIFEHGEIIKTVPQNELVSEFLKIIKEA